MDLRVFAPPDLTAEARRFLAPFEVNSIVSSIRDVHGEGLRSARCLLYLSGYENPKQVSNSLRALARWKVHTIVLFARKADHRTVVDWARVAERVSRSV